METSYAHVPVMCEEILTLLTPALSTPDAVMLDATLGLGGHSAAALSRFPQLTVIGIDRDPQALDMARSNLGELSSRVETHQATYDQITEILDGRRVDAILFDLGLSSLQIDSPERGFAYAFDAPLNMRMDGDNTELTAADVVNTYSARELERIFRLSDEKYARRIAQAIVDERDRSPFTTSARLVSVISAAVPAKDPRTGHPAKRVFQALRMEVNSERDCLIRALPQGLDALKVGGLMAVLSYHSGEDRLVKRVFTEAQSDQVPPGIPIVPESYRARFAMVTRGAHKPSDAEAELNPRAKPARLRVITRTEED